MAVFAVLRPVGVAALAATTAMAAEDVSITTDATYPYPDGLSMQGTVSNKIEHRPLGINTGIFGTESFTVTVNGDASMTTGGLNSVVGNAYELADIMRPAMQAYVKDYADTKFGEPEEDFYKWLKSEFISAGNNAIDFLIPKESAAPTLTATGAVTMEGPANVIMLGSTVTGNTVSLKNNGTTSTSLGAVVNGVLGEITIPGIGTVNIANTAFGSHMETLNGIQGNFNIIQGSTVGDATTKYVSMHATAPSDALAANLIVGGSTVQAMADAGDIDMTGMATIIVNTPLVDAAKALTSGESSELAMLSGLLQNSGAATTIKAANDINLGSKANLLHGGNFDAAGQSLLLDAGNAVNITGAVNAVSGNVIINATDIDLTPTLKTRITGTELANLGLPNNVVALLKGFGLNVEGKTPAEIVKLLQDSGLADKLATTGINANVVTGGATLKATNNITMGADVNAVLDTQLSDVVDAVRTGKADSLVTGGTHKTTLTATNNIDLLGRLNVVNGGQVVLDAGNEVNMEGTFNVVSGGAEVYGDYIKMTGQDNLGLNWGDILPSSVGSLADGSGITDKLSKGINGNLVAGGTTLAADNMITTSGMATVMTNATVGDVMDALYEIATNPNASELEILSGLLQNSGAATSVRAKNIDLNSRLNLLHGGNFTEVIGENALRLDIGNTVNMNGTFNVVSGNVIVNAENINLTGQKNLSLDLTSLITGTLGADVAKLATDSGIIGKIKENGINANVVTGGATLTAGSYAEDGSVAVAGNITMDGMVNAVLDTQLSDVVDAVRTGKADSLVTGGTHKTTLTATNNINLQGRLNVVNGGQVVLDAGNAVNMEGTFNVVSGGAEVYGDYINMTGQDNLGLNWGDILPGSVGSLADGSGITDKLSKGINGNLVAGGTTLAANKTITTSGMATVMTNATVGDVMGAMSQIAANPNASELEILSGLLQNSGAATSVRAKNIDLNSRLNLLHGGNFTEVIGENALRLDIGNTVNMNGTFNVVSGNVIVDAKEINLAGQKNISLDWGALVPDKYAGYGDIAAGMGIFDKLEKGVNGNVVAGGATLTAEKITMTGMATAIVDTTAANVVDALRTMNASPLVKGGTHETLLSATNIDLSSRLNVVNGGKVLVDATDALNMTGTFNVVSGNAHVEGNNVTMDANSKVGIDITPVLTGHYAEIAQELGMTDMVKGAVSSNVIAGGATVSADTDVTMKGYATAIVDTSLGNVISAVKQNDLGQLMKGGTDKTLVTAEGNINLESQLNVVNGGNASNAGGVSLEAGKNVNISGDISVINRANVTAGENVNITSDKAVLKNATITANGNGNGGIVSFTNTNAEMTDGSISGAGVQLTNATLSNTAKSDVTINSSVAVDANSGITNYGALTLNDASINGGTLYNAGSMDVNGSLTLQEASLVYVAESLLSNSTAITLGNSADALNPVNVYALKNLGDAISSICFVLPEEVLADIVRTETGLKFSMTLFTGATSDDYNLVYNAVQEGEISFSNGMSTMNTTITNAKVEHLEGDIVITGYVAAAVPEPTTATLSLLALAALAARRRRRAA